MLPGLLLFALASIRAQTLPEAVRIPEASVLVMPAAERLPLAEVLPILSEASEPGKPSEGSSLRSLRRQVALLKARLDAAPEPEQALPGAIAVMGERGGTMSVTIHGEELKGRMPTMVRIHAPGQGREPAVEIPMARPNGSRVVLLMGRSPAPLRPLPARPVEFAVAKLRGVVLSKISFKIGELVRVRDDSTGRIERMTYLGRYRPIRDLLLPLEERRLIVEDSNGASWTVPRRAAYKDVGAGEPSTLSLEPAPPYIWPRFEGKDGLVGTFLEGAAWLSSHPEFLAATHAERWKLLASYVSAVLRPGMAAHRAEHLDLGFPELLALGHGVCRHSATLFVAVLREAGYDAKLMMREEKPEGHAWVEVRPPPGAEEEPWVFDVQNRKALPWSEARAEADKDPESMSALWYLHPDRFEHPSSPRVPE